MVHATQCQASDSERPIARPSIRSGTRGWRNGNTDALLQEPDTTPTVRMEVFYPAPTERSRKNAPTPDRGGGAKGLLGSQRRYFAATTFRPMTTARITRIPL